MSDPDLGTVLVTGGAGFLGCALAARLAPNAARWVAVDSLHPQVHPDRSRPEALPAAAELRIADVTRQAAWDELLADVHPDVIVHLAAETGTAQSLHEASRHAEVNVVGTTRMLDALARADAVPRLFLLASSRAVYGEGRWRTDAGEVIQPGQRSHARLAAGHWDIPHASPLPSSAATTPPSPTSVYGATKVAQEQILGAWTQAHDSALGILRLQNVYGPGQSLINSYTGIVSLFSRLAAAGETIPVYEDGLITRDFVFIDDVAEAFAALATHAPEQGVVRYDVGSGRPTTILDLARTIAGYHGAPEPRVTGAFRDGDVRHAACEIDDTTAALGWRPAWSLADGIAALQEWIAAHGPAT